MNFQQFKKAMDQHINYLFQQVASSKVLFITNTDKDILWNKYLDSFPPGTNEIFRKKREHDCSCCRAFIKSFGNVVIINDDLTLTSIWDFETNNDTFQPVVDVLAAYVKSKPIVDVFLSQESQYGADKTYEKTDNGVTTWSHFCVKLPKMFTNKSTKTIPTILGESRDKKNVFQRSLNEISLDATETVLELIAQDSLYKGVEWKGILETFRDFQIAYRDLAENLRENYCWITSIQVGNVLSKIKNHSIGVLLSNISEGMELNEAVRKYEAIVAPTNYKRPKTVFTQKMVENAQKLLTEMGLLDSLGRRHATLDDIRINNILFANRDAAKRIQDGNVFDALKVESSNKNVKKFDKVEEVPIDVFINQLLPCITNIEILLENRHSANLVSLIAPKNPTSPTLFKWSNGFSWAYNGNIADSMKTLVKAHGGNVEGVLRFSIQWNTNGDNNNDFDAHCIEPNGNHIYFPNKGRQHTSTGILDVDIRMPDNEVAVENITWSNIHRMQEGQYEFYVHNYQHRGGRSGFKAELEYDEQIYSYDYGKELRQEEKISVVTIDFSRKHGIKFIESLSSTVSNTTLWGLPTNQFHPVSVLMFSPNYWDEQKGIGNKHFFFLLKDCQNDTQPNGFFNEFLREEFMPHRKVFEALGSKMMIDNSTDQLSGVGFSITKRDSIICKVDGSFKRTIKIVF